MPGIGRKRDAVAHIERVNDEGSDVLEVGGGEINLDDSQEPSAEIQDPGSSRKQLKHLHQGRSEGAIFETPRSSRNAHGFREQQRPHGSPLEGQDKLVASLIRSSAICRSQIYESDMAR